MVGVQKIATGGDWHSGAQLGGKKTMGDGQSLGRVQRMANLGRVLRIANGGDWNAFVCGAAAWRQETKW